MDDISTWEDVAGRLGTLPRGATTKLAKFLEMDQSYLRRKLESRSALTTVQARKIRSFLDGDTNPASERVAGRLIPVYGYAAASGGDRIAFNPGEVLDWMELPMGLNPRGEVFVIRALGSSMEPRIFDGESLVVQKSVPPAREKDAVIEFSDGSAVVKTYKAQRSGQVFGYQYNPPGEVKYDATSVRAIHSVLCRL